MSWKSIAGLSVVGGMVAAWMTIDAPSREAAARTNSPKVEKQIHRDAPARAPARQTGDQIHTVQGELIDNEIEEDDEREAAETDSEEDFEMRFNQAERRDDEAISAENTLNQAFAVQGAEHQQIECRKSFCRIEATFADTDASDSALSKIFVSGDLRESLPNLASTVTSRDKMADGSMRIRIYLYPD